MPSATAAGLNALPRGAAGGAHRRHGDHARRATGRARPVRDRGRTQASSGSATEPTPDRAVTTPMLPSERPRYSATRPMPPKAPATARDRQRPGVWVERGGGWPGGPAAATRPTAWATASDGQPADAPRGQPAGEVAGAEGRSRAEAEEHAQLHPGSPCGLAGLYRPRFARFPRRSGPAVAESRATRGRGIAGIGLTPGRGAPAQCANPRNASRAAGPSGGRGAEREPTRS